MKKLFNKTFFNLLLGFLVIITLSFTLISFVGEYNTAESKASAEIGVAE